METADQTTLPGDGLNGQVSGPVNDFELSPGTEANSLN